MIVVPAIDLIDGQCVRLTKGDYNQKTTYGASPVDMAKQYEDHGFSHLHLVDLDGAKSGQIQNAAVLQAITAATTLKVDFGGGIKRNEDIALAFDSGANQVTGGSIAAKDPELMKAWISKYGADKLILGADVKERKIAVGGWLETTSIDLFEYIESYLKEGIQYVICTDISKDGLLQGSANELYAEMMNAFPQMKLIASGGVTSTKDLELLQKMGVYGAIVGKAIYEGRIDLRTLKEFDQ